MRQIETLCAYCAFRINNETGKQIGCKFNRDKLYEKKETSENYYTLLGFCNYLRTEDWLEKHSNKNDIEAEIIKELKIKSDIILIADKNDSLNSIKEQLILLNENQYINNIILTVNNQDLSLYQIRETFNKYCIKPGKIQYAFENKSYDYLVNDALKLIKSSYYGIISCKHPFKQEVPEIINELINKENKQIATIEIENSDNIYINRLAHLQIKEVLRCYCITDILKVSKDNKCHYKITI